MASHGILSAAITVAAALLLGAIVRADSIDPEANTDGFNPVASAYQVNEARRQDMIARQLDSNYRLIYSAGCGPWCLDPFEPWPRVPGDIWGYPGPRPIEHPVGHKSGQIGPNRWIYRPLYAVDLEAASADQGRLPAAGSRRAAGLRRDARLPGPSDPGPENPAPAARLRKNVPVGPRAF